MKKFLNIFAIVLAAASLASCSMFKLDNFDGPNAQIHGRLLDAKTGEPIGVEAAFSQEIDWANVDWSTWTFPVITISKGSLVVNELGWKNKEGVEVYEDQRWFIRFDGQYRNNLIFAADYKVLLGTSLLRVRPGHHRQGRRQQDRSYHDSFLPDCESTGFLRCRHQEGEGHILRRTG